jgi:hypothetical protein
MGALELDVLAEQLGEPTGVAEHDRLEGGREHERTIARRVDARDRDRAWRPAGRSPRLEQQPHSTSVRSGDVASSTVRTRAERHIAHCGRCCATAGRITRSGRCGRRTLLRTVASQDQHRAWGIHMTMRRTRIVAFDVAEDGTVELPEGAVIISLEFESEGSYGYETRPARVWANLPVA